MLLFSSLESLQYKSVYIRIMYFSTFKSFNKSNCKLDKVIDLWQPGIKLIAFSWLCKHNILVPQWTWISLLIHSFDTPVAQINC